jgi:hypothetical protein
LLLPPREERPLHMQRVELERGPLGARASGRPSPSVEAMSDLVAELSHEIADAIRALPAEQAPEARPSDVPDSDAPDAEPPPRDVTEAEQESGP